MGFESPSRFIASRLLGKTTKTTMSPTKLTDLPLELLEMIAIFSMPDGYQALRSTCRRIYAACDRYTECHRRLCLYECWTSTRGRADDTLCDTYPSLATAVLSSPLRRLPIWHLLRQIARAPIVARYIWHLNLSSPYSSETAPPQLYPGGAEFFTEADLRNLRDLMDKSPAFSAAGFTTDYWWARLIWEMRGKDYPRLLVNGSSSMVATLLALSLLPNLKELRLSERWSSDQRHGVEISIVPLLTAIIDRANAGHPSAGLRSLQSILTQTDSVAPRRYALADLTGFLRLRALTTLVLADRVAFPLIHERDIVGSLAKITAEMIPYMDHLTSLSLLRCCIAPDQLILLLDKMPRLRSLSITASNTSHFEHK